MKTATKASDRTIQRNLQTWLDAATPEARRAGLTWYDDAQKYAAFLSVTFNVSRKVAAGVISALSPNNKWERNKIDDVKVCTYGANKRKAFAIANGDQKILESSPKTHAFAMNVGELSADHVTVDKWHMRACLTNSRKRTKVQESPTKVQYKRIERITARMAKRYGLKGYELQAIIWVTIKENWEA